jgi:hypothetical protein
MKYFQFKATTLDGRVIYDHPNDEGIEGYDDQETYALELFLEAFAVEDLGAKAPLTLEDLEQEFLVKSLSSGNKFLCRIDLENEKEYHKPYKPTHLEN